MSRHDDRNEALLGELLTFSDTHVVQVLPTVEQLLSGAVRSPDIYLLNFYKKSARIANFLAKLCPINSRRRKIVSRFL